MPARYIFRMDDITPGMDWERFWALMQLFIRHDIKPLLGIVPDNRDPNLNQQSAYPEFWDRIRELIARDSVDIAQHGYQHILVHRPGVSLIGKTAGIRREVSEFAGDSYADQVFRIKEGQSILKRHGIYTRYWMAPNHSYDQLTLRALRDNGFSAVSDGVALFPYTEQGLVFVPQTSWKPRWMPLGVHTICIHTNAISPNQIKSLRTFLRRPFHFTRFSSVANNAATSLITNTANQTYDLLYKATWAAKRAIGSKALRCVTPGHLGRARLSERALPQPLHQDS